MRWPSCDLRGSRRRCRGPASAKAAGRLRRLHARGAPRQPTVIDGAHGEPFPEPVEQYGRYRVILAKHRADDVVDRLLLGTEVHLGVTAKRSAVSKQGAAAAASSLVSGKVSLM